MKERSKERQKYHVLRSIPWAGGSNECRLIGEIGDIHHLQSVKQLNAYVGIDIRRNQISTSGNKHLRKILYFMIQGMLMLKK